MSETPLPASNPTGISPILSRLSQYWGWFVLLAIGAVVVALLLPSVHRGREAARRTQCKINLKQIALALHAYEDKYGSLPPACTVDGQGRPLHSWRTLILPFLDQQKFRGEEVEFAKLYASIDLSKAWDDPVNAEAAGTPLGVYRCPSDPNSPPNYTTYFGVVGPKACFPPGRGRRTSEIRDNVASTLMLIEVPNENAVPWISPADADEALVLNFGPDSKLNHTGGGYAVVCDASVRFLSATIPAAVRQALMTIADGDDPGSDW